MKRFVLFILAALTLTLSAPALAIGVTDGPAVMAQHVPADSAVFVSLRVDDGYVSAWQSVVDRIVSALPPEAGVPPLDLRAELNTGLADGGLTYDQLQGWLGDYLAFSLSADDLTDSAPEPVIAVQIDDRAGLEAYLDTLPVTISDTQGDFTVYTDRTSSETLLLSDTLAYFVSSLDAVPQPDTPRLSDNPDYAAAVAGLPAPAYNIVAYLDLPAIAASTDPDAAAALGDAVGVMSLGFTLLDERSLTADAVATVPGMPDVAYAPVDPAFGRFIPAGTGLVIHASDLTQSFNLAIDNIDNINQMNDPDALDARNQIRGLVGFLGLDLDDDILNWTTGDFALFADVDVMALFAFSQTGTLEASPGELGVLIEATDPERAANLAGALGTLLSGLASNDETVTVTSTTLGDVPVTQMTVALPLTPDQALPINLYVGATDDVFFFATEDAARHITEGGTGLDSDPTYSDAAQFFLPGTSGVLYTDDNGLLTTFVVPLALLLGPAIDNVFDNINDSFDASAPPTRLGVQADPMGEVMAIYEAFAGLLASSSITSTYADGVNVIRAVITLE